ncbi:sugar nucleotide-binding protein [Paenarthrobacter ureafaciens]
MSIEFSKNLARTETPIPGVFLFDLAVHGDNRGWFKENWQREKMVALGLPDFKPVQNNISFNEKAGTTRGIHAEPWDKFISVACGRIFGAWVDLREGPTFGAVYTARLDAGQAIFIPRGVGNAFQTLEDNTAYTYLVNDHWSAEAQGRYSFVNLADVSLGIDWPIDLTQATLSDQDRQHPMLEDVVPVKPKRILVLGANGQLGMALREAYRHNDSVDFHGRRDLDITDPDAGRGVGWGAYSTIINAAAYTSVDEAESDEGRRQAWATNVSGIANLAKIAIDFDLTLVNISSDYVFDGQRDTHPEEEPFSPLGVYGQTKAAGDAVVSVVPKHYTIRTSWVVGHGQNFVLSMAKLAARGVAPDVVNDQFGRLTFTDTIAAAIQHLLDSKAEYGTYNVTNSGEIQSWAGIAADVFQLSGNLRDNVRGVSSKTYFSKQPNAARRPKYSALKLDKIISTGFFPALTKEKLRKYMTP